MVCANIRSTHPFLIILNSEKELSLRKQQLIFNPRPLISLSVSSMSIIFLSVES